MYRGLARLALALLLAIGLPQIAAGGSPAADAPAPADRFAPLAAPALGDADRARLDAGEVLIRDLEPSDPNGIGVLLMGLVDATPDQVWEVMQDCEAQDEFLPRISHAAVQDREGDSHTCDLVVDLPLPLSDLRTETRHRVRRLPDGGHQRRWDLLPGDWSYLRNSGSWTVHPYSGGGRSLLVGRMDLLPKSAMPNWVLRAAQARQAPETFAAIRARVRQILSRAPASG
jgi:ribosome-associated toxin RatA of RatAB toxin-antitoxin module